MSTPSRTTITIALAVALAMPLVLAALGRPKRGTLLGMPYNFERPTRASVRRSL